MEWLQTTLGVEDASGLQLILITLGLAIGLILIVWIFRKIFGAAARRTSRNRVPRLSVTDQAYVDDKRRLVIVRRDNVEHLLMVGGPTDVVVESGIMKMQQAIPANNSGTNEATISTTTPQPAPEPEPIAKAEEKAAPTETAQTSTVAVSATTAAAVAATVSAMESTISGTEETSEDHDASDNNEDIASSDAPDDISSALETAGAVVSVDDDAPEPEVSVEEPVIEVAETEPGEEIDLESTISASLDDALSSEPIVIDEPAVETSPAVDAIETSASNENETQAPERSDDEMQRLLDELADETKELA